MKLQKYKAGSMNSWALNSFDLMLFEILNEEYRIFNIESRLKFIHDHGYCDEDDLYQENSIEEVEI